MKLGTLLSMAAMAVMGMGLALPAQAADPIKIGVYLPLTGQNAFGGQLELEGIQLAHKLKPTVLDRPVELVVVDNKSDKVEAANAVKRLTEHEKVLAIIGTYGSSLAMAGGEVAERAKGRRSGRRSVSNIGRTNLRIKRHGSPPPASTIRIPWRFQGRAG